jgi:site-specific recombinase XerD
VQEFEAAAIIDRRLSTTGGFYRFAHIDGRISSNPDQYVRRPTVRLSERRGLDSGELARLLPSAATTPRHPGRVLGLNGRRVSEACDTKLEDMGMQGGHRVLSSARAPSPPTSPWCRSPPARTTKTCG